MSGIEIRRLSHALGAEVVGVDLRQELDAATVTAIKDLWDEHLVLLFRDQDITPGDHVRFTHYFGPDSSFDISQPVEGHPQVQRVTNKRIGGKISNTWNTGRNWHSDLTWSRQPAYGSILRCLEKPDVGGDTMFTNLGRAYETLSPKLQEIVDGLEAVHDYGLVAGLAERNPDYIADVLKRFPPVVHKCVQVHPKTGRKFLFVGDRVRQFVGMSEAESKPILRLLVDHATRPEFVYRHQWRINDLLMWQNLRVMHHALADFDQSQPRDMQRTTIAGEIIGQPWVAQAA